MHADHAHLAVQVKDVECEDVDLDLDVFDLDVLALSSRQLLERQQHFCLLIPRHSLTVDDEGLGGLLEALWTSFRKGKNIVLAHSTAGQIINSPWAAVRRCPGISRSYPPNYD